MKFLFPLFICLLVSTKAISQVEYYGGKAGEKFDFFLHYLENYYVDDVNNNTLTDLAIKNVLTVLDPFSVYQTAEESENQLNADKGYNPKGAGLGFYINDGSVIINYITSNGPADRLGITALDQLVSINNTSLNGLSKATVNDMLSGPTDTLSLTVKKHGGQLQELSLIKTLLPFSSIVSFYMLNDKVGYIKMVRFTTSTETEFLEAVNQLKNKGLESLILDLRGNPGGVKPQALAFTDHFLNDNKLISYSQGLHFPKEENKANVEGVFEKGKLIVLTDNVTASASELFSVAIQDWDRGIIVGGETYGKGLIQQSYKLNDASTVRLTIAKYYSPTGRLIQKNKYEDWLTTVEKHVPENRLTAKAMLSDSFFTQTKSGRKVLSGLGGVIPDVFIKKQDNHELNNWKYYNQGYAYDFALNFCLVQKRLLMQRFSSATDLKNDIIFDSQLNVQIKDYLFQKGFTNTRDEDFVVPEAGIKKIKAWITSFLWDDNSYHELNNEADDLIKRATHIIESHLYDEILK